MAHGKTDSLGMHIMGGWAKHPSQSALQTRLWSSSASATPSWDRCSRFLDSRTAVWPPGAMLSSSGCAVPQSIDALAEALQQFEGGVVIISHDAQLLSRVCDETSEVHAAASSAPCQQTP